MDPETRKRLGLDPYTASIELSNACRQFYQNRLRLYEEAKAQLDASGSSGIHKICDSALSFNSHDACSTEYDDNRLDDGLSKITANGNAYSTITACCDDTQNSFSVSNSKRSSSIHNVPISVPKYDYTELRDTTNLRVSIVTLRQEMISLMDRDLSLMKQLLTLNESIEELKQEQRYSYNRSNGASSSDFSDIDLFDSEIDLSRNSSTNVATCPANETTVDLSSLIDQYDGMLKCGRRPTTRSPRLSPLVVRGASNRLEVPRDTVHRDQNSFDSGIHCGDERIGTS